MAGNDNKANDLRPIMRTKPELCKRLVAGRLGGGWGRYWRFPLARWRLPIRARGLRLQFVRQVAQVFGGGIANKPYCQAPSLGCLLAQPLCVFACGTSPCRHARTTLSEPAYDHSALMHADCGKHQSAVEQDCHNMPG